MSTYSILKRILAGALLACAFSVKAQKISNSGLFSLGLRVTLSSFDGEGTGPGAGGQFRIQLSDRVNTDWYADYIEISSKDVKSIYYHIGWSVLFYPFPQQEYPRLFQPYILAGHCFDYNQKSLVKQPAVSKSRWGSAVQAGLGTHFNLSPKLDISLTSQYMLHLTKELEALEGDNDILTIKESSDNGLEGHLLTTLSINYKLGRLWRNKTSLANQGNITRNGLTRTQLTISPSYRFKDGSSPIYLHGVLEHYFSDKFSLSGEAYLHVGNTSTKASAFDYNHSLFFGPSWHYGKHNHDPYLGIQPGLAITQMNKEVNHIPETGTALSPLISGVAGYNFYINSFMHFFVENRLVLGTTRKHKEQDLSEYRFSAGLGFNLNGKE